MTKRSLYDVLGVDGESSTSDIESAYQAKSVELKGAFDEESLNEMKLLEHAHTVLTDPEQRLKYNKQLKLEKLMQSSAIQQREEKKKEGGLMPLLLIVLVMSVGLFFGYRHYAREHTAQQHSAAPANPGQ